MTGQPGVIYMLHFDRPYKHAKHYVGWTDDLFDRLEYARQRARRSPDRGHLASRDRLHPHPHLRRHPPHRTRHQERRRRAPVLPGLHPPAVERPLAGHARRIHPPHLPQPRRKAVTPMPKNNGSGRNQRNNPYQLEELFIKFHRTPAGIAWRWRTELAVLAFTAAALRWLDTWTTLTWAAIIVAGLLAVTFAVPHSRRFITRRAWCVLARHRLQRLCYEARLHTRSGQVAAHSVDPADPGRGTHLGAVPRGHLRRGLRRPHRRAKGRLLRPRRAGHPQPPVVPPDHHRHHPPRHPRGQSAHQPPRWSG